LLFAAFVTLGLDAYLFGLVTGDSTNILGKVSACRRTWTGDTRAIFPGEAPVWYKAVTCIYLAIGLTAVVGFGVAISTPLRRRTARQNRVLRFLRADEYAHRSASGPVREWPESRWAMGRLVLLRRIRPVATSPMGSELEAVP
jgi:hypothetical protein